MNRKFLETTFIAAALSLFLGSMAIADLDSDNSKMNQVDQNANGVTAEQQSTINHQQR